MPVGGYAVQPKGHYDFCRRNPLQCRSGMLFNRLPRLTDKGWKQLATVNFQTNRDIRPITDADQFGVEERWIMPSKAGDCEDYALLKRARLMHLGWPRSSLLLTVVRKKDGEAHAVLTVRTDRGDFVLDNLRDEIHQWDQTGYRFLKRQSPRHAGRWQAAAHNVVKADEQTGEVAAKTD